MTDLEWGLTDGRSEFVARGRLATVMADIQRLTVNGVPLADVLDVARNGCLMWMHGPDGQSEHPMAPTIDAVLRVLAGKGGNNGD